MPCINFVVKNGLYKLFSGRLRKTPSPFVWFSIRFSKYCTQIQGNFKPICLISSEGWLTCLVIPFTMNFISFIKLVHVADREAGVHTKQWETSSVKLRMASEMLLAVLSPLHSRVFSVHRASKFNWFPLRFRHSSVRFYSIEAADVFCLSSFLPMIMQGGLCWAMGCSVLHRALMRRQSGEILVDCGPLLHK